MRTGENQYSLMNADIFRTILTEHMLMDKKKTISIEGMDVRSISYGSNKDDEEYLNQAFLYLADSVCGALTRQIGEGNVEGVKQRAQKLINKKNLVFAYDEVDSYFKNAWQALELGEYYDALSNLYKINILESESAALYMNYWVPYLREVISKQVLETVEAGRTPMALVEAIAELKSYYMTNLLNPSEAEYIFKSLEKAAKSLNDELRYSKILYDLNDIGVIENCHKGNLKGAEPYFKKCEKYATAVDIEEYTRTRNRFANALLDSFEYEKAIGIIRVTMDLLGGLYNLSKDKLGRRKQHFGALEYAKTLSQAGQAASYLRDEEALSFFDDALSLMKDDIYNTKITQSYKIHYLIEAGDKDAYEEAMREYNEGFSSIIGQIKTIESMGQRGDVNISFALFMYLKGLNKFYTDDEIQEAWPIILEMEQSIDEARKHSHPWELIYKYMGILALRVNEQDKAEEYCAKTASCIEAKDDSLVSAIACYGEAELLEAMGDKKFPGEKFNVLFKSLAENYPIFTVWKDKKLKAKDKRKLMEQYFSYTYR